MSAGIHCQRLSLQRKKIHLIEFRRFNLIDFYVITSDDLFIPDYYSLSLSVLFVVLMFTCTSVQVCRTPGIKAGVYVVGILTKKKRNVAKARAVTYILGL